MNLPVNELRMQTFRRPDELQSLHDGTRKFPHFDHLTVQSVIIRRLNRSGGRVHDAAVDSVYRATIVQPLGQAKWLRNKAAA
jgi:hypothetical protein